MCLPRLFCSGVEVLIALRLFWGSFRRVRSGGIVLPSRNVITDYLWVWGTFFKKGLL